LEKTSYRLEWSLILELTKTTIKKAIKEKKKEVRIFRVKGVFLMRFAGFIR
jgi:hypothetical protein